MLNLLSILPITDNNLMMANTNGISRNSKTNKITENRYAGFTCLGGHYIHQVKKLAIYEFEELFLNVKKNIPNRKWDVIIFDKKKSGNTLITIDANRLKKFKNYFGRTVEVHIIPLEHSDLYV